jgi:uncharacterized protein (DUF2062 family)
MDTKIERSGSRSPVIKRLTAGLVLAVIAYFLLHAIVSVVLSIVIVAAVVVAVGWALKTLLW